MNRGDLASVLLVIGLVAGGTACERRAQEGAGGDRDTLVIDIPENVEEEVEEGARQVGGKLGEAVEETGKAIEEAGERIQEEAEEPGARDSL